MATSNKTVMGKTASELLESYMFPEGLSKWMPRYSKSPELMTLFYMLFAIDSDFIDSLDKAGGPVLSLDASLENRIRAILCVNTRDVIRYSVHTDFILGSGLHAPMGEVPRYETIRKMRTVKRGSTLLVRLDKEVMPSFLEVQILENGLFDKESSDHRVFLVDLADFNKYSEYISKETRVSDGYSIYELEERAGKHNKKKERRKADTNATVNKKRGTKA